jgi:exodeoxyribonuclease V gamma subunit
MPLKFFPDSSFAYAENLFKDADQSFASILKAKNKWNVEFGDFRGESEDPYFKLCFGKINLDEIFDDVFCNIAVDVLSSLLNYRKRININ